MQRALSTMRARGRWVRRLIAVSAVVAVTLPGASALADWRSDPTVVAGHGQAGHYGPAANGLGDDGVLRVLWGEGRRVRMAHMTARGRVLRRFTVARKRDPSSTPTIAAALPGGRTVVHHETSNGIVVASFDRTGKRRHIRRFPGVSSSSSKPQLISRGRDGAALCWAGSGSHDVQVSAALISPTGVIGPRLRVTPAGADFSDDCSITRGPGGALVVGWHVRGRDDEEIFIRQIAADGRLGPAVPVRPDGEPGNMWYMAPVAVTAEGRVAVGWTVGDDRGRGQHRMRWIEADGTAGRAIDLSPRTRDATELTLETAGDRAVAIVDDGGKVTAQDILPDATVGPRRTLLDARYTHSSSTSNREKIAVVVQGITGGRSSIYVIERSGPNWRKPARLAHGGASNWPANQSIALNSDGQVAVAFNVSMALPIIAELGVRAVVSR